MLARSCLIVALGLGVIAGCGDDENDDGSSPAQPDPTGSGNVPGSGIDGGAGIDASTSSDGGSSDGGLTLLDGRVLGGSDGGCDIADPVLGCGKASGGIVRFDSGLEIDRTTGLAWSPVQAPSGAHGESAWIHCQELSVGGFSEFDLPTINQVRTLAAGCAPAVMGGTCKLADKRCVGPECGTDPVTCGTCEAGKGPHRSGGYCRPELAECVTAWALTACDDNGLTASCPVHQHWFYDVRVGGFGLSVPDSQLAGRCVARIAKVTPPVPTAPATPPTIPPPTTPPTPPTTPPTTPPSGTPGPSTAPPPVPVPAP